MADPDLTVLAARAHKGDRAAFEKIVQATARLVYAQIVARVRDRQRAEDLTQETFVRAWKAIGTLATHEGITGWLVTLARNVTLDAMKAEGRLKRGGGAEKSDQGIAGKIPAAGSGEAVEEARDDGPTPAESAEMNEAREHALAVLEELPEEYRSVLSMRYLAGADYETIRRALSLSDGALRGLLNRGMALLRERVTRLEK